MTTVLTITLAIAWPAASATARYWWWRASHDRLTGLPGRELLEARARRACWRASVGVLLLDLDGFKQVNDTFGHRLSRIAAATPAGRLRDQRGEVA
ncbi:diguanylate cyclase domain-containing protein [Thermocrispum municipale]|uniref:diguanylate cyclase domain-containing protein n=1 Tax=Thermocrispum municipale TaxID=37926 RepID=UPI000412E099|nr:diguanylate cyclase [Thermocrispum municipale]